MLSIENPGDTNRLSPVRGRFAPSPTGRMHLGNVASALASWLSVRSRGGQWILRIEDLDPQRSRLEYARQIEDDLHWLGLDWDEGGIDDIGSCGPYIQSHCSALYDEALRRLEEIGLTYPCYCTRADIMSTQAPHASDGRIVYRGTCRPVSLGGNFIPTKGLSSARATRLVVPDRDIVFIDRTYGIQRVNLARHCGDFVLRRYDGAWAYQLAVVVDDARMGISEIVRGSDLLLSSSQQLFLYNMLGLKVPEFAHIPLICNADGIRLSKRDQSLTLEYLRTTHLPKQIIGYAAWLLGITSTPDPVSANDLVRGFCWDRIPATEKVISCLSL